MFSSSANVASHLTWSPICVAWILTHSSRDGKRLPLLPRLERAAENVCCPTRSCVIAPEGCAFFNTCSLYDSFIQRVAETSCCEHHSHYVSTWLFSDDVQHLTMIFPIAVLVYLPLKRKVDQANCSLIVWYASQSSCWRANAKPKATMSLHVNWNYDLNSWISGWSLVALLIRSIGKDSKHYRTMCLHWLLAATLSCSATWINNNPMQRQKTTGDDFEGSRNSDLNLSENDFDPPVWGVGRKPWRLTHAAAERNK